MTVVRVLSEPGRLNDDAREKLAEALTSVVLDVEVGSDNSLARGGIMVLFEEQPTNRWAVGGRFDDRYVSKGGRLLVITRVMAGVWTPPRRRQLIERFSAAISEALDFGSDRSLLGSCWILLEQIENGSWGAYGGPLSLLDLLEPAQFAPEQTASAREQLEQR